MMETGSIYQAFIRIEGYILALGTAYLWISYLTAVSLKRFRQRYAYVLAVIICASVETVYQDMIDIPSDSLLWGIKQAGRGALLFLSAWILIKDTKSVKAYLTISFLAVRELCLFLSYEILVLMSRVFPFLTDCYMDGMFSEDVFMAALEWGNVLLLGVFSILTYMLIWTSLRILKKYLTVEHLPGSQAAMQFLIVPVAAGFCVGIMLHILAMRLLNDKGQTLYDIAPELYGLLPLSILLLLMGIFLSVRAYCKMAAQERADRGRILLEQQIEAVRAQVIESERVNNSIRGMKHDMRNHLSVIRQLADKGDMAKLADYLNSIEKDASCMEKTFNTGDSAVDALLMVKAHEMVEIENLSLDTTGFILPPAAAVMSYDLCVVLGNALDNAIRACRQLKQAGLRTDKGLLINLSVTVTGSSLLIKVTNPYDGHLIRRDTDGSPASDKATEDGKNGLSHGIGYAQIRRIADKYYGTADWQADGHIFTLMVLLSMKQ